MPAEQWRPVPGFPDYEVSSFGRVVSHKRPTPYEMQGSRNQRGYRMVHMTGNVPEEKVLRTVHRLVAEIFLGPCPEGMEVRHLDGDKDNNAVSNLRFGTQSQNTLDMVRHGVHNMARKTHCPQDHPYDEVNTRYYNGRRHCRACRRRVTAANVQELAA